MDTHQATMDTHEEATAFEAWTGETIASGDLRRNLSEALSRVGYGSQRIMVTRNDTPVAGIVPPGDLRLLQELYRTLDANRARSLEAVMFLTRGPQLLHRLHEALEAAASGDAERAQGFLEGALKEAEAMGT